MSLNHLKPIILICLLGALPTLLWSSDTKVDSFIHVLNNYNRDTISDEYAELLYKTAYEIGAEEYYFEAIVYYERSLKIAELTGNRHIQAKNHIQIGVSAFWMVDSEKAIEHLDKALAEFPDINSSRDSAIIYTTLGNVYYDIDKKHLSYLNTLKGIQINPEKNDIQLMADGYYTLAKMDLDQKNYDSALEKINKAISVYEKLNRIRDVAFCYDVVAQIYLETEKYELALEYVILSCEIDDDDYEQYFASYCAHFKGEVYEGMKDFKNAEIQYKTALEIMESSDQYGEKIDVKSALGKLYSLQGKCAQGLDILEDCLAQAKKHNLRPMLREVYHALFEANNHCKNYRKAIGYFQKYSDLKDSLINEGNLEQLAQLSSTNELFHQKQQVEILRKEQKLQSFYGYGISAAAIVLLIFVLLVGWSLRNQLNLNKLLKINYLTIENQNEKLTSTVKDLEDANEELKQFAYVVSHDLKAPLRGISSLAAFIEEDLKEKIDEEDADEIFENLGLLKGRVTRMGKLINGILEYSRIGRWEDTHEPINLNEFLPQIVDFVNDKENTTIQIAPNLPTFVSSKTGIQQIFQNLISNAIKYNDKPHCFINIDFKNLKNYYQFCVKDNGPGIDKAYHEKVFQIFQILERRDNVESTGVGLSIVKKQVENLGGKVWIDSEKNKGAVFHFTIKKEVDN